MSQRARPALPATWRWVALQELGDWSGGGTPSKADAAFWRGGNIPWVSPKDMKADIIRDTEDHIADVALEGSSVKLLPRGTVLVVTRSGILQHTLPLAVTDVPVTVNQDLKALSPHAGVHPRFIAGALKAVEDDVLLQCSKDGTTVHSIDTAKLLAYEVPISPSAEQHRIVDAVDSYLSRLDEAVDLLERAREKLKRYRAAVLKTAVEGRLVPTEAELARAERRDYEPAQVLLRRVLSERQRGSQFPAHKRRSKLNQTPFCESQKAEEGEPVAGRAELSVLPEGWCWVTVDQIASDEPRSIQSGPFGSNLRHSEFQQTGRLVIGIDNVQDGRFTIGANHRLSEARFRDLQKYQARPGDVLITVMATIGRCCVVPEDIEPAIITKHVYRITLDSQLVLPRFILLGMCQRL